MLGKVQLQLYLLPARDTPLKTVRTVDDPLNKALIPMIKWQLEFPIHNKM